MSREDRSASLRAGICPSAGVGVFVLNSMLMIKSTACCYLFYFGFARIPESRRSAPSGALCGEGG